MHKSKQNTFTLNIKEDSTEKSSNSEIMKHASQPFVIGCWCGTCLQLKEGSSGTGKDSLSCPETLNLKLWNDSLCLFGASFGESIQIWWLRGKTGCGSAGFRAPSAAENRCTLQKCVFLGARRVDNTWQRALWSAFQVGEMWQALRLPLPVFLEYELMWAWTGCAESSVIGHSPRVVTLLLAVCQQSTPISSSSI